MPFIQKSRIIQFIQYEIFRKNLITLFFQEFAWSMKKIWGQSRWHPK